MLTILEKIQITPSISAQRVLLTWNYLLLFLKIPKLKIQQ